MAERFNFQRVIANMDRIKTTLPKVLANETKTISLVSSILSNGMGNDGSTRNENKKQRVHLVIKVQHSCKAELYEGRL